MTQPQQTSESIRRGVVAVIVRQQRLLVIRRSAEVVAPGKLCFPGGAIEGSETETAALIREIREELDVAVRPTRRIWQSVTPWQVALAWWLAEVEPDARPVANPAEVASVHWHTPGEMATMDDLLEGNHRFLEALARGEFELF